jgi:hypothetical protein
VDPAAQDLEARLVMRSLRAAATVDNILPTNDDDSHMELSFQSLPKLSSFIAPITMLGRIERKC